MHDGGDYLTYGSMALILDNLIARGTIPPLVAAFSWPGDRLHEYSANEEHAAFVVEEALPRLDADFSLGKKSRDGSEPRRSRCPSYRVAQPEGF